MLLISHLKLNFEVDSWIISSCIQWPQPPVSLGKFSPSKPDDLDSERDRLRVRERGEISMAMQMSRRKS